MAIGDLITAADYNTIRNKIIGVIGTGAGTSGYGQPIQSSSVSAGSIITKNQWDLVRFDIYNALLHQTGAVPNIVSVLQNSVVRYSASNPVTQYETLADQAIVNRLNIGPGRFAIETKDSTSRTTPWSTAVSCTTTVTFGTADQARYFFNAGGNIRLSSSRTGGTATAQNTSWSNLLSAAGVKLFNATTTTINFYNLTNVYQTLYTISSSVPYSANTYSIQVRGDVANNINGGARILNFLTTWSDPYEDPFPSAPPPDAVDGTLSLILDQQRATGSVLPSGNFTIASPTYSTTTIDGS